MKELFYGLLFFLLLTFTLAGATFDYVYDITPYKGSVVIDKSDLNLMTLLKNDTVTTIIAYDIVYDNWQVKDTIR